ncbi:hypothetical protein D9757_007788 [Collybiopsis confluens]|uniref:Uncharacterized protein n=1 Tax=Collybiopsis confluens TaxID=2823264 RepID=A0A8H5HQ14_9AGAR|nr:hypothetical protein D9757_007788 [Collybiopsis confluens]
MSDKIGSGYLAPLLSLRQMGDNVFFCFRQSNVCPLAHAPLLSLRQMGDNVFFCFRQSNVCPLAHLPVISPHYLDDHQIIVNISSYYFCDH